MSYVKLSDLPPGLRAQAERQLAPRRPATPPPSVSAPSIRRAPSAFPDDPSGALALAPRPTGAPAGTPPTRDMRKGLFDSKTEERYFRDVLHGHARIHPLTFHMASNGSYTPDFATVDPDGTLVFHEVKGAVRLQSADGANRRFFEAAHEYPQFRFVWAVLGKDGRWTVKHAVPAARPHSPDASAGTPPPDSIPRADGL